MNNNKNINNNFIYKIIENDLKKGTYSNIITRFSPEPNGYLHIGHAKSIFLNFSIANKYNGICNLRFDDTNPSKEKIEYIESIKNDINWLGYSIKNENIKYTSDYFDIIFNFSLELINKNLAYVDESNIYKLKNERGTLTKYGIDSIYRNRTVEENIYSFIKMKNGFFKENEACLRAKIDMKSSIILMRDPILYRIKYKKHIRTGYKWCIYPTYDFSHCICDALENITHSICTLEFINNKHLYNWILNNISLKNKILPIQYEFSKLDIEYNLLSKRKLNILIKNNIIEDWDDPRIMTISGLRNRGYNPGIIKNFCNVVGITKQESNIKVEVLENCVRKNLYKISRRIMGIINPIKVIIENLNDNYNEIIYAPNYPNKKKTDYRKILFSKEIFIEKSDFCICNKVSCKKFSIGKYAKLRYSYIILAKKILKDKYNNSVIYCLIYKNTLNKIFINNKKVNKIIHWVSCHKNISIQINIYNNLLNYKFPNKIDNILSILNKDSHIIKYGFLEASSLKLKKLKPYQFERIGYFYTNKLLYKKTFLRFFNIINL